MSITPSGGGSSLAPKTLASGVMSMSDQVEELAAVFDRLKFWFGQMGETGTQLRAWANDALIEPPTAFGRDLIRLGNALNNLTWQSMDAAPKDGTWIQARIPGHGADNVIAWMDGLQNSADEPCGGWSFVTDQEPPDSWTDGICWDVNEDGVASVAPTAWKRLPPAVAEGNGPKDSSASTARPEGAP